MQALRIDVDDEVLLGLQRTPEVLAGELRLAAAVKWYEMGTVSQEKGAQIAGLNRSAFIEALGRFGVSPFQETVDDILSAVRDA
jgi:predicted HTH domain antitoxin